MHLRCEKENKMATSILHDLVSAVEHEISCPICFEDFEEPKCLPNCAHNICQQCLQGMEKKRNSVLECPVCRVESVIPKGGVAAFPKNHLLVRLIEQSPGRKEKRYLKEAVKRCKEKLQGAKDSLFNLPNGNVSSMQFQVAVNVGTLHYDTLFAYLSLLSDPNASKLFEKYYNFYKKDISRKLKRRNWMRYNSGLLTYPYLQYPWLPNGVSTEENQVIYLRRELIGL